MAGRGNTIPKDPEKRQRKNAAPETTDLDAAPVTAPRLLGSSKLLPETRAWYRVWCGSPQAKQFIATDWQRLHMLAKLVELFHRTESPEQAKQLLGEIRLNEQKLGGTPEDRLRLRWRLRDADQADERANRSAPAPSRKRRDPRLQLVAGGDA